jgi:elongation factor G
MEDTTMSLRESSVSIVITPKTDGDRDRLQRALRIMVAEDPDCHALVAPDGARTLLSAPNINHLERLVDRLKRDFLVEAGVGGPTSTGDVGEPQ